MKEVSTLCKILYLFLICSTNMGCTGNLEAKTEGAWIREITDGEFRGTESIEFRKKNKVTVENILSFDGVEDGFEYQVGFITKIEGDWIVSGSDILINFDTNTFTCTLLPGTFRVFMTDRNNEEYSGQYKDEMKEILGTELTNRFKSFYQGYSDKPFKLMNVQASDTAFCCRTVVSEIEFNRVNR